ncbi:DUF89 family protein [Pseudodesulfovibrio cashew]|uniref:DUF89 family protein n=1 Tax=Pseudodesulfovibrio cashew TaxID=2678688 RepID=A0A6I6JIZ9_9BACT|nr:ARMT1-like domain-containing protein [Pseudodesulfovibrio cashew]QGY41050.1 DUF89 family protein [Pseudodesulfovibrio cashew]
MKTSLKCMPCFMRMALHEAELACPGDEELHREIIVEWGRRLGEYDLGDSPPALARHLAELIREKTGCGDLYLEDKRQANARVQQLMPELRAMIEAERGKDGGDPLSLVLEMAVVGNYIDRGVDIDVDWEAELACVSQSLDPEIMAGLQSRLKKGADVLVLGDNTGEIVLDTLLVEELQRLGCHVTYAVRSHPVINDATMADAEAVGLTALCEVVESGVDTPGTVIERCFPDFVERMRQADVILSKGQGNFEALEGVWPGVFCAFKVKCERVARDAGLPLGSSALHITTNSSVCSCEMEK